MQGSYLASLKSPFFKNLTKVTLLALLFTLIVETLKPFQTSDVKSDYVEILENKFKKLQKLCKNKNDPFSEQFFQRDLSEYDYQLPRTKDSSDGETSKCSSQNKIAFAKTHKTGSSTLQNIFFRYGIQNNLTFALPLKSWLFPLKEKFDSRVILQGPWKSLSPDLFVFHSVWNYDEVKKVIPDAKYVTILRDPVSAFESNYVYMGLQKFYKKDINEFAKLQLEVNSKRRPKAIIGKNQLLWDLGMAPKDMENVTLVKQKIEEVDKQFDLVLMLEKFDESLILMKDFFCWTTDDVSYLIQNERIHSKKSVMSEETKAYLKDWLWADYMLYEHFLQKFNRKLDKIDPEYLREESTKLRERNEKLKKNCVIEKATNSKLTGEFKMALNIVLGYVIDDTKPWCVMFARSEPNFYKQIRDLQDRKVKRKLSFGFKRRRN